MPDSVGSPMTREQWLEWRRGGYGGSDVPAILGLHPTRTRWDVFAAKMGVVDDVEPTREMKYGTFMERRVAEFWAEESGAKLIPGTPIVGSNPLFRGTPDFFADMPDGRRVVVEVKVYNQPKIVRLFGDDNTDFVPPEFVPQPVWYMGLAALEDSYLACQLSGRPRSFRLPMDADFYEFCKDEVLRFHTDYVSKGKEPPVDTSKAVEDYIKSRYPVDIAPAVTVNTPELDQALASWYAVREQLQPLENEEQRLGNILRLACGDASGLIGSDGRGVSFIKNKDRSVIDYEALLAELRPPQGVVDRFTTTKTGARYLRAKTFKI